MESKSTNTLRYVDWFTVAICLLLVCAGAVCIYAASYDFDHANIFSFKEFSGKQFVWIGLGTLLGLALILVDSRIYETYAFPIYVAMLGLLALTIFIAPNVKGSHSWIVLGPVSLQPAEFGKCATALALAKLFSGYGFSLSDRASYMKALAIIFLPVLLIIGQDETGSALVYFSLFFVLYREGMSGLVLLGALCAVVIFVVSMKFADATIFIGVTQGQVAVFVMLMILMVGMLAIYCKNIEGARNVLLWFVATTAAAIGLHFCGIDINGMIFFIVILVVACGYSLFLAFRSPIRRLVITVGIIISAILFLFSVDYVFNNVLMPHQQRRILVSLGIKEDIKDAGYNVNQSKIAIGSGGVFGKGFLNGTQTKLKFVPEQHTDFIFCTIGEEYGLIGSSAVLILFLILILRVITIAERQPSTFGRVYAYCVASYLIFHLCINVGMVIGLCPVIGIPLPFFSYGGSSLWGFTFLIFILLSIDARRREHPSY